jgi:hypothetical protein
MLVSPPKGILKPGVRARYRFYIVLLALLLAPSSAQAYVGPAIAFVGYIAGPVVAVIAAVVMLFAWPAWQLIQKIRGKSKKDGTAVAATPPDDKKPDAS